MMNVHNLMKTFAVTTLAILSQAQLGWTAGHGMQPQTAGIAYCSQLQQPDEEYCSEPQPQDEDYCMRSQPSAAAYCADQGCYTPECRDTRNCIRKQFYGEFLYLRPLNAGLEYAVPINGPIAQDQVPIQMGRTAALNPDFSPGFRVGGSFWLDDCTTISATFSHYENNVDDAITTDAPLVIRSMVVHPSSLDASADWLAASAHQYIRFELADIDYRQVLYSGDCSSINYLVGIRYANLQQQFDSQFESIIVENVNTLVDFEGGGLRLGLEAEHVGRRRMWVYGKAYASFLGGEFRGSYLQGSTTDPVIVQTDWKEARLVSILECEAGIGWMSCNGRVRASAGYMVSSWLNVVKSAEFISAVQANNYHGPDKINGNGLVFDGFVAHVEIEW